MLTVPQYEIISSTKPMNFFFGGYGCGKTKVMADISIYFASNSPAMVGLIASNTYGQLTRSTLFRIFSEWTGYKITEFTEVNPKGMYVVGKRPPGFFKKIHQLDDYRSVISFRNGAIIFLASLDNYKSLDGMEVAWMLLDETKDTKKEAINILIGRLRQKGLYVSKDPQNPIHTYISKRAAEAEINPMYIFTAPSREQWLYDLAGLSKLKKQAIMQIRDELYNEPYYSVRYIQGRKVVFSATQSNAKNLPANYVENMQRTMPTYIQDLLIYGFPFAKEGGEFYKYFSVEKHVQNCTYRADLPLCISFDENVVPYAPCGIWQVDKKDLYKIDEIDLEQPRNNVYEVCAEILKRYSTHRTPVYIFGDATSNKRDAKLPTSQNFFSIVKSQLHKLRPILRVPKGNPKVIQRSSFLNAIHEKNIYDIRVLIDPKCQNTINDYRFLKEDSKGGKLKQVVRDPITGVSYQKYGHDSDLDEYFICEYFKKEFLFFNKGERREIIDPLRI